jgi:chromate transport protein ChrA
LPLPANSLRLHGFGGAPGAAVALVGLMGPSLIIVTILAFLYARFGEQSCRG